MEMECTRSCFWWGLLLSGLVTFGGGTFLALAWLFLEWVFSNNSGSSSSDYGDDYDEDKPFDIDDDLSADDEIYIYENFIKK